ncbi:E3 ubiquitin-protein ligase listerin [Ceratobasidium sp. AG-Ba]|nr:E3 ubiquitin-protein ligase listerin [Ceratobasidium sp. AG-Ba]
MARVMQTRESIHYTVPGHPVAYDRMESDKLGQELTEDAAIWNLYLDEANNHDQEMVKGRHASLDMLLLFVRRLGSILTAFLIESKSLLQQDPAEISVALLYSMAQSHQRMELGLPPPSGLTTSLRNPEFTPSLPARWINGIWFTSLGISLTSALLAMLGKEWLTAFLGSRPRPAHSHALLRQSRIEGLERWWALHLISLLPFLLHTALLLFSVGLVLYLWTMDTIIAIVFAGLVTITFLFYISTAILGAVYEFCPFVTEMSGYLRGLSSYFSSRSRPPTCKTKTVQQDLRALAWLADHASDPVIVDCAYQALAGLRVRSSKVQSYNDTFKSHDLLISNGDLSLTLKRETTTLSLLAAVSTRFERIMRDRRQLAISDGTHAVRYAVALRNMIASLQHYLPKHSTANEERTTDRGRIDQVVDAEFSPLMHLALIENLWTDSSPPLCSAAYAGFLAVQMDFLSMAARDLKAEILLLQNKSASFDPIDVETKSPSDPEAYAGDVTMSNSSALLDYRLAVLRACYSRTLARITQLLRFHQFGEIYLEPNSIVSLTDSICIAARCGPLNPADSLSTHHPTIESQHSEYHFAMPLHRSDKTVFQRDDLRTGPLGALIFILRVRPNMPEYSLLDTRMSALDAFSALAPVLLQQMFKLEREELVEAYDFRSWSHKPKADLLGIGYIAVRQMLTTLRYLGRNLEKFPIHIAFCNDVVQLIYEYLEEAKGAAYNQGPRLAVANYCADLVPIMEYIAAEESSIVKFTDNLVATLLDLSTLPIDSGDITPCDIAYTPACFLGLLRIVSCGRSNFKCTETVFDCIIRRLRGHFSGTNEQNEMRTDISSVEYLRLFTHSDKGFDVLVRAANHENIKFLVVNLLAEICRLASGRDRVSGFESIEISRGAVCGLSAAVFVATQYMEQTQDHEESLLAFLEDAFVILMVASEDQGSRYYLIENKIYQRIYGVCQSIGHSARAQALRQSIYIQGVQLGIGFEEWYNNKEDEESPRMIEDIVI